MGGLFRSILRLPLLEPILRPITRFLVGTIAIPLFRLFLRNVVRMQELDKELEKDLEQWFRAAFVLLVACANMEQVLFGWVPNKIMGGEDAWIGMGLRILLAIGVIDLMPDQELFAVIHPGPPEIKYRHLITEIREKWQAILWGIFCKYLNRSSPVFVILTAIFTDRVGWVCYGFAIVQYLIIGLVTSRDKAMDVLSEFDKQVAEMRRRIVDEFVLMEEGVTQPAEADSDTSTETNANGGKTHSKVNATASERNP